MKNILLFNELAEAGKAKEKALALQKELSVYYRNLELMSLKGLDLDAFLKTLEKDDNVILLGGDGTINHFVNQIGTNLIPCPLFLSEAGTGNDFALDVAEFKDEKTHLIKINGFISNLPYVEVKGRTYRFINGIGYGIDGECCVKAEQMKKEGATDIDYSKITIDLLLHSYKARMASVKVDDMEYKLPRVYIASAMNGRYYGGGMKVAPNQVRGSGKLSFVSAFNKGKFGMLMMFPGVIKGTYLKHKKNAIELVGKCIEVKFDMPTGLQIDGEVIEDVTSYKAYIK